MHYARNLEHE
jgi:hypothetical protein